jgi:hypothetical protein
MKRDFDSLMKKTMSHLTYHYPPMSSALLIVKQFSDRLKARFNRRYLAPLSFTDRLRAQKDFVLVQSIRRKLKKANLILRVTDKSKVFYIGRAVDFEQKAQAYRTKTKAYMELPTNPLEEIFFKVIRLLNELKSKRLILAKHLTKIMPDKKKIKLAHMYFIPKSHKVTGNLNII